VTFALLTSSPTLVIELTPTGLLQSASGGCSFRPPICSKCFEFCGVLTCQPATAHPLTHSYGLKFAGYALSSAAALDLFVPGMVLSSFTSTEEVGQIWKNLT
jgi:hypothetical protein